MKSTKRMISAVLAFVLSLALLIPTGAFPASDELPGGLTIEMIREQYEFGEMFVGSSGEGSFVILHNGAIVYESHARHHGIDKNQVMFSVTKSVVSALAGIAIGFGYIESVDQYVIDFFPDARIRRGQESKREMTIYHLLTMQSGMPGMENMRSILCVIDRRDSGLAAFMTPQIDAPGETFRYCSGATPQTLVGVIERATGQNLYDFAREHLFGPLGMDSVEWATTRAGSPFGGFGMRLSPSDMLRFGYLFLNDGVWEGERILPEGWIEASTEFFEISEIVGQELEEGFRMSYGYMWWSVPNDLGENFSAMGLGGAVISIYPEYDMVIARTGVQTLWLRAATWIVGAMFFPHNMWDSIWDFLFFWQ